MRSRALLCALLLCSLGSPGCALWHRKPKPPKPAPPSALAVGTVTLVNEEGKFVLVDNGALPVPPVGGVLKCYAAAATEPSAELVATDVRKRPFTIADIREGAPHKGDRVVYIPPELQHGKKTVTGQVAAPPPQPSTAAPGFQ
ncbi:MAG TPA: hypothetical protein VGO11_05585 [Chthoniobacteraceae bacterium]|nr:hypothetical protein [Chthoniobacteraceae bacterium]